MLCRSRQELQGEAQDRDRSGRGRSGRISDPQVEGAGGAGRRLCEARRRADQWLAEPARHPRRHGGRGAGRVPRRRDPGSLPTRSEEHTSELQSLMRISYAVFCLTKQNKTNKPTQNYNSKYKRTATETEK